MDGSLGTLDRFRVLFEHAPLCIHEIDADGRLLSMNRAGLDLLGVRYEEDIRGLAYLDFVSPAHKDRVRRLMADAFEGQASEFEFAAAGTAKPRHFTSCFIPCRNAYDAVERLIGISADISECKKSETELRRLNRTYAVLSRCNNSLARTAQENDLLDAFCRNLVDVGGYCFAWVGYASDDGPKRIRMVAHAGHQDAEFSAAAMAWANDENSPSACRVAIRAARPVILRSIEAASDLLPWREAALSLGYRSMIALPLKAGGQAFGNFSIFATEPEAFNEQEVKLLTQLSEDLAFGIETARAHATHALEVRRLREEAEQEERRRIAATLHDRVGQSVQSVNLGLKRLRALLGTEHQLPKELLDQVITEVAGVIGEVREISHELRPLYLERMDLGEAIRCHCSGIVGRAGADIRVSAEEGPFPLEDRVKEQGYLCFHEAMGNALKHAGARRVDVSLGSPRRGLLTLRISDDGEGFDMGRAFDRPAGLGLSMIRERAESVGGHAEIQSAPGEGTTVTIRIPVRTEASRCRSA
ncbi:MAG: GAF domain-containing protein [Pseudomonadota bacterium]|nr:GAF domain-containing protein [Pseudomonadota bacterium]